MFCLCLFYNFDFISLFGAICSSLAVHSGILSDGVHTVMWRRFLFCSHEKKKKKKGNCFVCHMLRNCCVKLIFCLKIRSEKCWRVKVVKLELVLRYIQLQQMMRVSSYFYISGPFVPPFCYTCTLSDHGVTIIATSDNKFIYSYLNC